MRVEKTIWIRFNGDWDESAEFSIEFDDWEFTGSKEECLEQISDLLGEMSGGWEDIK